MIAVDYLISEALLSCTACGSMRPSSTGRRRRLPHSAHKEITGSRDTAGRDVPAGTMAMVSSTDFMRASERSTATATLNLSLLKTLDAREAPRFIWLLTF